MRREHLIKHHLVRVRLGDTIDYTIPSSATYGTPTTPLEYPEPLPANGDRTPSAKSPFNYRGTLVANNNAPQVLTFESSVERNATLILQTNHDIVELQTQQPTLPYRDTDGKSHTHTFDICARLKDGRKIGIAAKPILKLIETDLVGTLLRIKQQGMNGLLDDVNFVTEKFASDDAAQNAREILLSRRLRNEEEYQAALEVVKGVRGPVRFRALFVGAEVPAHRRTALWCLIDEGLLRPAAPGRIEDTTLMIVTL
ncbi:hypothetical protein [Rhizobium sp. M1]|uniref:hypothetical protein n=1 Tax=Rhizobium sp. M1 TaxID=2035453 RepID=UPI000BE7BD1E|nr:hypothetical protein [Rhizobium sp. M1]PDT10193.1 hypothetical protein CO655_14540 [Rhizobium sp. M1]